MQSLLKSLLIVIPVLLGVTAAMGRDRVALVIGNSDYAKVARLPNPINDAADIAAALERIGFTVTLAPDLDGNAMRAALHSFSAKADNADMALVYYAGHGIEIDKQNYLIPVDATLATDRDVSFETVPLDLVSEAVSGAKTLRVVLLDACRNNPFSAQMTVRTANRSIGRGLSAPELGGGTLVAYSAKGGTVAEDGAGRNSPFAKALLDNIEQPGLEIDFLFRKVRDAVLADTSQRQEPFIYGSLPGVHIYLVPPVEVAAVVAPVITPDASPVASEEETTAWQMAGQSQDAKVIQDFIYAYPRGFYLEAALDRLRSLSVAVPDAERAAIVAPVLPPAVAPAPPSAQLDPEIAQRGLIIAIQTALRDAGCSPGAADGRWGPRSRDALAKFAARARLFLGSEPTLVTLAALQGKSGTRCAPPSTVVAATTTAQATTAAPIDGNWSYQSRCTKGDYAGTLALDGASGTFRSSSTSIKGVVSGIAVQGGKVSFTLQYQAFGTQREAWNGTLQNSGRTIAGSSTDSWGDNCSFTAMRQ